MPSSDGVPPLPWHRHRNGFVVAGLLATLTVPLGTALAEYEDDPLFHLLSLATAALAFALLVVGLRLGPIRDDPRVEREGGAAQAVVERAVNLKMTRRRGGRQPSVARVVRLDLRVEADEEPTTRVRLRRWVDAEALDRLHTGAVLPVKVLPGRPQDPALDLGG